MKTKIFDMHVHSQNSHDSKCPVECSAKEAIKKGVSGFVISDHCDIEYYKENNEKDKIKNSISETFEIAEKYKDKLKILKGIELGEGTWNDKYTKEIVSSFDYDAIIGSCHAVRYKNYSNPYSTIDFSKFSISEITEYIDLYFDEVFEMINKIPCNIMAHLTCPLRYITGKYKINIDLEKYGEKITKILEFIIKNSIALEINTSGINTPFNSFMPCEDIIRQYKNMGGYLITVGSDAHTAENIANGFNKAFELLKKYGFTKYFYYEKQKPQEITLIK